MVSVAARASGPPPPPRFNIHGRHVDVTPPLEAAVRERLAGALAKLQGGTYLEAEGGVAEVDVRLMNRQVSVTLTPRIRNKSLHDTFLRQGALKVVQAGDDVLDGLDKAVGLERKLRRLSKPPPHKKAYSRRV